jgi:methylmalonyl-CoA mutase
MSSEEQREKLFGNFPPVTTSQWEEKIREDLKGAEIEKLIWHTPDGISVRPFYRNEDISELPYIKSNAGEYPYIRGIRTESNDWEINQDIVVNSFHDANKKAVTLLEKGVTAPRFILGKNKPVKLSHLDDLLNGIDLQVVPVRFSLPDNEFSILNLLLKLAKKQGIDTAKIKGSVDLDPLGYFFRTSKWFEDAGKDMLVLKNAISFGAEHLPSFRILAVKPEIFHNAGATICQELGLAIAMGAEYMAALTNIGLNPAHVAKNISFHFATGSEYFPEIAKLRAARLLWSALTEAFAPGLADSCKIRIECSTSSCSQTVRGQYNNLLRGTTQAMSAVLGGADSLTVLPFDNASGNGGEFSERLARNIQHILREEAYFNKVVDPGAGSYYIENLTYKISENAWNLFIKIEKEGGILNAFSKGKIQEMIDKSFREKLGRIENKTEKIVGVNYHPEPDEKHMFDRNLTGD